MIRKINISNETNNFQLKYPVRDKMLEEMKTKRQIQCEAQTINIIADAYSHDLQK
jgi:transposase-like protein